MKAVDPSDKICLLLDETFMPFRIITARAAFFHLLKKHGQGISVEKVFFDWDDVISGTLQVSDHQPVMRSVSDVWVVPTIFKLNGHFFRRIREKNKKKKVSLRDLFNHYHGKCQYCGKNKPFYQFSKDHVFPKSKGGSDDDFNLILSCKKCNSEKGDQFPYRDHTGKPVQAKGFYHTGFFLTHNPREEWKTFLFLDNFSEDKKDEDFS